MQVSWSVYRLTWRRAASSSVSAITLCSWKYLWCPTSTKVCEGAPARARGRRRWCVSRIRCGSEVAGSRRFGVERLHQVPLSSQRYEMSRFLPLLCCPLCCRGSRNFAHFCCWCSSSTSRVQLHRGWRRRTRWRCRPQPRRCGPCGSALIGVWHDDSAGCRICSSVLAMSVAQPAVEASSFSLSSASTTLRSATAVFRNTTSTVDTSTAALSKPAAATSTGLAAITPTGTVGGVVSAKRRGVGSRLPPPLQLLVAGDDPAMLFHGFVPPCETGMRDVLCMCVL